MNMCTMLDVKRLKLIVLVGFALYKDPYYYCFILFYFFKLLLSLLAQSWVRAVDTKGGQAQTSLHKR